MTESIKPAVDYREALSHRRQSETRQMKLWYDRRATICESPWKVTMAPARKIADPQENSMIEYALLLSLTILDSILEEPMRFALPKEIYRVWIHSVGEDTDKEQVYRPKGYEFPPARGREGFEVKQKSLFVAHEIGPADGQDEIVGQWQCNEANVLSITFPDAKPREFLPGEFTLPPSPRTLHVLYCDNQILKIKKKAAKKAGEICGVVAGIGSGDG